MLDTYAIHSGEVIRTMTPAEYVKVHNIEEARRRQALDLKGFVAFMAGELRDGALSELTPEGTDRLVAAYLGAEMAR